MSPQDPAAVAVLCRIARAAFGVAAAIVLQQVLVHLPSASAAVLTCVGALLVGAVAARAAGLAAAVTGDLLFSAAHLADRRGILGTGSVAWATLLVLVLAGGAALAGHAWWVRSRVALVRVDDRRDAS